jgi:hypothetical protein
MGFTHFSQPIAPKDLYEPLPLEAILQGNKTMYERGEKNFQKIQSLIDNAYNLPSLQGKDTEVKNKIIQSYMDNVSELAKGDLRDAKTSAQIEGYINRVARDPQILGIVDRATVVAQEQKAKRDYELKGKKYISPILDQASEYLNQGVFLADKKFNEFGFVAPDISEYATKANSLTPVEKTTVYDPKTRQYTIVEGKNKEKLKENFYLLASQDPNTDKLLRYQFNQKYKDLDWDTEGQAKLTNDVNNLKLQIAYGKTQGIDTSPYEQSLQQYETLLQNPSLVGKPLQEEVFNTERENYFNTALQGAAYANQGIPELSDLGKLNLQQAQAIRLKEMELQKNSVDKVEAKKQELQYREDLKRETLWATGKIKDLSSAPSIVIEELLELPSDYNNVGALERDGNLLTTKVENLRKNVASTEIPDVLMNDAFKQTVNISKLTKTEKEKLNKKGEIQESDVTNTAVDKEIKVSPESYFKSGDKLYLFYPGKEKPVVRTIPQNKPSSSKSSVDLSAW